MKKIVMIGALWTSNFGDVLLADLFYKSVKKSGHSVKFFGAIKEVLDELNAENATFKELISSDILMFIGGGYLSEPPNNTTRWILSRYKKIYMYADLFNLLRKDYYILDVGAGPINNSLSKYILKRFCSSAKSLIVRDSGSVKALKGIGVKNEIKLSIDFAISLSKQREAYAVKVDKHIALHLSSRKHDLNKVIIGYFMEKDLNVWFIEDHAGEYEKILKISPELNKLVADRVILYKNYNSFIKMLNSFEFILTSKLHVGIVASVFQKKVCSFPYHGKVINYYKEINREDVCLEYTNNNNEIIQHIEKCLKSEKIILNEIFYTKLELIEDEIREIK